MAITASLSSSASTDVVVSLDNKSKVVAVSVPGPKGDSGAAATASNLNLNEISNINSTNLADGSILMYSTSTSKWIAKNDLTPETGDIILSGGNF
jgi:hypothetical protein